MNYISYLIIIQFALIVLSKLVADITEHNKESKLENYFLGYDINHNFILYFIYWLMFTNSVLISLKINLLEINIFDLTDYKIVLSFLAIFFIKYFLYRFFFYTYKNNYIKLCLYFYNIKYIKNISITVFLSSLIMYLFRLNINIITLIILGLFFIETNFILISNYVKYKPPNRKIINMYFCIVFLSYTYLSYMIYIIFLIS